MWFEMRYMLSLSRPFRMLIIRIPNKSGCNNKTVIQLSNQPMFESENVDLHIWTHLKYSTFKQIRQICIEKEPTTTKTRTARLSVLVSQSVWTQTTTSSHVQNSQTTKKCKTDSTKVKKKKKRKKNLKTTLYAKIERDQKINKNERINRPKIHTIGKTATNMLKMHSLLFQAFGRLFSLCAFLWWHTVQLDVYSAVAQLYHWFVNAFQEATQPLLT